MLRNTQNHTSNKSSFGYHPSVVIVTLLFVPTLMGPCPDIVMLFALRSTTEKSSGPSVIRSIVAENVKHSGSEIAASGRAPDSTLVEE